MLKFYDEMPDMECLQGDTLQIFDIPVSGIDNLSGCTMVCIIEDFVSGTIMLTKSCTKTGTGFQIQLTSTETAGLAGTYKMHFRMTGADGLVHRKLSGTLVVNPVAQGG